MPEGHTIHRLARLHRPILVGNEVSVSSPQGRFSGGAELLNGERVEEIEAYGKHLFYRWTSADVLHIHLGLFGKFRTFRREPPPPTEGTRLALHTGDTTIYLAGPTACELLTIDERDAVVARLGPDPLRRGADGDAFGAALDRRSVAVAAALLDQKVVAGIGNVYRAEILFLAGIHPLRRAKDLGPDERAAIWDLARSLLRRGEKAGRIVTVDPADVGERRRSGLGSDERLYVYKRGGQPCRRCGTSVELTEVANRKVWWCPSCQPG